MQQWSLRLTAETLEIMSVIQKNKTIQRFFHSREASTLRKFIKINDSNVIKINELGFSKLSALESEEEQVEF